MILLMGSRIDVLRGVARGLEARSRTTMLAIAVDLTSMRAVRAAVMKQPIDAAVLVEGLEDPDLCEEDPDRAFTFNAESAIHLAAACREARAKAIFLSTAEVFGRRGGPWSESDDPVTLSTLARTKAQGEAFLTRAAPGALVLRTGPILGDRLEDERRGLAVSHRLEEAEDEHVQPIAAYQVGLAIEALLRAEAGGTYHVAPRDPPLSRAELLRELGRLTGLSGREVSGRPGRLLSRRAPRATNPVLLSDKLGKVLGGDLGSWRDALDAKDVSVSGGVLGVEHREAREQEQKAMGHRQEVRQVTKPWGHELIWAHTERYVGKVLFVKAGERLSLQYHEKKDETIYVLSGKMVFEVGPKDGEREDLVLKAGDAYRITPFTTHRMIALEDTSILEASTPELDDVVRLEDKYGRTGTKAP